MTFLLPFLIAYLIIGVISSIHLVGWHGINKDSVSDWCFYIFGCPLTWIFGFSYAYSRGLLFDWEYESKMAARRAQDLELYGC